MTRWKFLSATLIWFTRTNLAVVLGMAIATAVIGGALVVGDSMRFSLREMTLARLGPVDELLTGPRFFREALAKELENSLPAATGHTPRATIEPGLMLSASFEHQHSDRVRRAAGVSCYGVTESFWNQLKPEAVRFPHQGEVVLNQQMARELNVQLGETVTLWMELPANIPRDTLLGKKDDQLVDLRVTVSGIVSDLSTPGRFATQPNQQLPKNAFLSLTTLQKALDLAAVKPSRGDSTGRPARVNTLFVCDSLALDGASPSVMDEVLKHRSTVFWEPLLQQHLTLDDLQLKIQTRPDWRSATIESQQMILEEPIAMAAVQHMPADAEPSPSYSYLVNRLQKGSANSPTSPIDRSLKHDPTPGYSMYSTVAGIDLKAFPQFFRPLEWMGAEPKHLAEDEVVVSDWLANDLKIGLGDTLQLSYFQMGSHGELPEESRRFTVRGIVKLSDGVQIDRSLTPEVKGITDVDSLQDWDQPFPMDLDAITDRDEDYWKRFRAFPKAFLNLEAAQNLWPSRYGKLTSLRISFNADAPVAVETRAQSFRDSFPKRISPASLGMTMQPVKAIGLAAANGSTDFSGLFFGFSFFLIIAAALLIHLLFQLNIDQRIRQIGLLGAVGFTQRQIRGLLFQEGLLLLVAGGVIGAGFSIAYAQLMIFGLKTWWNRAVGTQMIELHVLPASVILGTLIAMGLALFAIWGALRGLNQVTIREQLVGQKETRSTRHQQDARRNSALRRGTICFAIVGVLLMAVLSGIAPAKEVFGGLTVPVLAFFISGMLSLLGAMAFLAAWLDARQGWPIRGAGFSAISRLSVRNASRQRQRTTLTTGLIAAATFIISAVAAGQKNPAVERPELHSGNGGFTLVAESSTPILFDLNTAVGRKQLNIRSTEKSPDDELWTRLKVAALRRKPGEESSCLNLFQTARPTILGVPAAFIERGGFRFANAGGRNLWPLLNEKSADGTIPVLGDMNTLMFSMKKNVGDSIPVTNAARNSDTVPTLKVAGMFDGAVFQGVLVMSEENFLRLFPEQSGYQYFLVECPLADRDAAITMLESSLSGWGFDAEPVADRLARFLAVQNTYLSTFQTLGGLGLLLGTCGLATVMLRNVLEREKELALLQAVGFTPKLVANLVLCENAAILGCGLLVGTTAALVAMSPHLLSVGADVPWISGGIWLLVVIAVGMASARFAVNAAVNRPILDGLRGE